MGGREGWAITARIGRSLSVATPQPDDGRIQLKRCQKSREGMPEEQDKAGEIFAAGWFKSRLVGGSIIGGRNVPQLVEGNAAVHEAHCPWTNFVACWIEGIYSRGHLYIDGEHLLATCGVG